MEFLGTATMEGAGICSIQPVGDGSGPLPDLPDQNGMLADEEVSGVVLWIVLCFDSLA